MERVSSTYKTLIEKLDTFIRKFYINKLIRGSLYTIGLVMAIFLIFNMLEYFFYFDRGIRKLMFGGFIITSFTAIIYWIVLPLIKYLGLGNTLSHEQAAHIIGDHFSDVKDRLLNILQLKKQIDSSRDATLLTASIEQKTDAIKLVPFKSAIDLTKNKKYLRYAAPPVLILLVLLFAAPSIIKDGTHRLINNDKEFEPVAPFKISFAEKSPQVIQFDDYTMDVKVTGDVLPADVFVEVDNFQYRLTKKDQNSFSYTFRNVQKNKEYRVYSGRVSSEKQTLKVLVKPNLSAFSIRLDYPDYTGRKDETIENIGDIIAPEGTKARWVFSTVHTENVKMKFAKSNKSIVAKRSGSDDYTIYKQLNQSDNYKVFISNKNVPKGDSVGYVLNVTKDQYPVINVEEIRDSLDKSVIYFIGQASDDYGLSDVTFHYTVSDKNGKPSAPQMRNVKTSNGREVQYNYTFEIGDLELEPGDNVQYYFQVGDNDAVNGSKIAKTGMLLFEKPTIEKFKEEEDINEEEIKDKLKEASKNLDELQKKFKNLREKLLEEKDIDWKDKKELQKLIEEQKKINEKLEKAKKQFEENLEKQEEFQKPEEQIQEKQEKMQELFEEATDPKKDELMEKIQQLMEELNKEDAIKEMQEMEQQAETQEKEMERLEELFKQLEVEKEASELMEELEKLAKEQETLAKETEKEEKSSEELKQEQEKLNQKMNALEKEMQELEKKNEELSPPKNLGEDNQEQMDDIQQDMEDSKEQMEQNDSKGASKSQKNAAKKMKKMASSLQQNMEGGDQEQQQEDMKVIRQLLENLVGMSFEQESLVVEFREVSTITPKYAELIQDQYKINDDFKLVEDSLTALANRNDKIQSYVLDKVVDVKSDLNSGLNLLEDRQVSQAALKQRTCMTNINDLALMLEESLQQMQQNMAANQPGSQMCQKPGGMGSKGKVPSDKITKGSKEVGEKMNGMMQKKKDGGKNSAKDFAEAAARQAALRKALKEQRDDAKERGENTSELDALIDAMNKIETDLVNKKLDSEMIRRQQNITSRLLEAEKANRQREYDNKRKAEIGIDKTRKLPPSLQEYLKKREAEIEMYKSVSPSLRPYYKSLVDKYYNALKSGK